MLRALALLLLCLASGAPAQAQAEKACDGRFERFLKGYMIGPGELDHFMVDRAAVEACRRTLDLSQPAHMTIDAVLLEGGGPHNFPAAHRLFMAACAQGQARACLNASFYDAATSHRLSPEAMRDRLRTLATPDMPVSQHSLAAALLLVPPVTDASRAQARTLLESCAAKGDHWCSYRLAEFETDGRNPKAEYEWLQKSAREGNVVAMLTAGDTFRRHGQFPQAQGWYQRAATADARLFFKIPIANARFRLAEMQRLGQLGRPNPKEARDWYQKAVELGHPGAKLALEKMK